MATATRHILQRALRGASRSVPRSRHGERMLKQFVRSMSFTANGTYEPTPMVDESDLFTEEHDKMRQSLRKIIEKDINPYIDEWEAKKDFPLREIFKILGDGGFFGISRPTEYGGLGLDYSYEVAVAEELGNINAGGPPMAMAVQSNMAIPALARFGSDELRQEFLVPAIAGDKICCIGVSEAGAGSDVAGIRTRAEKRGDDYIINGSKMWITNGCKADWMCLLANTGEGAPHRNKSLICVPMDLPGIHVARNIDKMGCYCSDTAEIYFEDVRVPTKNVIGEEAMGFTYQMIQFQEERLVGSAMSLLPMEKTIQQTIEYTRQRQAFGKSILDNQVVHFTLAELQTELECLRALMHKATALYVAGNDVTQLASMIKLKCGRLTRELSDKCLQYWGGMGFTNEVPVSRAYRDSRLLSLAGGSDEMMLGIICKFMQTLPKFKK